MIKLPKQARIWTVLILLTGGMGLSAMAQSAPPEDWTVSAQTTAAQCESDGIITLSNQNADALHNFTYSLLKKVQQQLLKPQVATSFLVLPQALTLSRSKQTLRPTQIKNTREELKTWW